jgi:GDP-D-mannose 3',5'-epimerase
LNQREQIVVAGAGGFIGGHLVQALLDQGFANVRAVDHKPIHKWFQLDRRAEKVRADLRKLEECQRIAEGAAYIFDLAADMGGMGFIENNRADCMLSVLIGTHLLLAARDAGVKRYFYASSACIYNTQLQQEADVRPLREDDAYPALPEDGYGWEKLFIERMCQNFEEDYGLRTRVARYHNVYGPQGTWSGGREKAPAAICRKVAEAVIEGRDSIQIWGNGEQTRSFMYIDDCVEGTLRIMEGDYSSPLNLGSSRLVTINGLVDIVEGIAGTRLRRTYDLDAPKGVRGRNSDNTLIRAQLGWEPSITLEEGLERTYRWVYDAVRSARAVPVAASAI